MYSKYSPFTIIENMDVNENIDNPVTRNEIYNELLPYINNNFITVNSLGDYVTKSELDMLPKNDIVDKLNAEVTNINTLLTNFNSGLSVEEIKLIVREEIQKVLENTFITKDQLRPNSLIPSYESFIFDNTFKNGCLIEYYNLNKDSDKFMNKFGSNSSFLDEKNAIDITFNNVIRDEHIGFKILTNLKIPKKGVYTFKIHCSGGCSFDIYELNGMPSSLIKEWNLEQLGNYTSTVYLEEGIVPIRILWYNSNLIENGSLKFEWKKPDDINFNLIPKSLMYVKEGNSTIKIPIKLLDNMENRVRRVRISGKNINLHFEEIEILNRNDKNIALNGIPNTSSTLDENTDSYLLNNGVKGNHSWDISKQPYRGIPLSENKLDFNLTLKNLQIPFYMYRHSFSSDSQSHKMIVYKRLTSIPDNLDMYDLIYEDWNSENNQHNVDFKLFNSLDDAIKDQNFWDFCGYRENIGFPGVCGEEGESEFDYQSKEAGLSKLKSYNWYYVREQNVYKNDGPKCCNHTQNGPNEFVEIDLNKESEIKEIIIYNRPDQDMELCSGAKLELFNNVNQQINIDNYLSGDNIMYFTF